MKPISIRSLLILLALLVVANCHIALAIPISHSKLDTDLGNVRYSYATLALGLTTPAPATELSVGVTGTKDKPQYVYKSPAKAFFLSLAVPGLGQYYYGSKTKAVLFFGADVAAWILEFKWHKDGVKKTDDFEAFNRAHWSRDVYEQEYLLWAYGVADDDSISATEISHHLPSTETQQYFEMTGKYDQFAWGWDDAQLDGNRLGQDYNQIVPPPRITADSLVPFSERRLDYERQRKSANDAFDRARAMVMAAIANRLISSFEALFTTKHLNNVAQQQGTRKGQDFSSVKVSAKLKSIYTRYDTPYVKVTYGF